MRTPQEREKQKLYMRQWRAHNPHYKQASTRYRQRNPEYVERDRAAARERMRAYRRTAKGILAEVRHNRRRTFAAAR